MNSDLFIRVRNYRMSVAIGKEMLTKGLINKEDFTIMCTVLTRIFGLKNSTIFSELDLITEENDGNITH